MMKAQASAEFLYSFAAALLLVAIMGAALLSHKESVEGKARDIRAVCAAESAARAIEAAMSAGIGLEFGFDSLSYRLEEGRFLVSYNAETIEIRGVFHDEGSEPL